MATTASSTEATAASPDYPALTRSDSELEYFSYDDQIVRMFVTATIVWGLVGTLAGLIVAILLVAPWLTEGLPWF
jgi:cbb3-type cytochrome oxidase subunit 1